MTTPRGSCRGQQLLSRYGHYRVYSCSTARVNLEFISRNTCGNSRSMRSYRPRRASRPARSRASSRLISRARCSARSSAHCAARSASDFSRCICRTAVWFVQHVSARLQILSNSRRGITTLSPIRDLRAVALASFRVLFSGTVDSSRTTSRWSISSRSSSARRSAASVRASDCF